MSDVSKELLPCPFCGSRNVFSGASPKGVCMPNGVCMDCGARGPIPAREPGQVPNDEHDEIALRLCNTRAQPAPADVVERLLAEARLADDCHQMFVCDPRDVLSALAAIPVSGEVEHRVLEIAMSASPEWLMEHFDNDLAQQIIARQALTPPRSIRVSDLTDEEVEAMRKPSA